MYFSNVNENIKKFQASIIELGRAKFRIPIPWKLSVMLKFTPYDDVNS